MLHEVYNNLRDSLWIHIAFIHQELYHFNLLVVTALHFVQSHDLYLSS